MIKIKIFQLISFLSLSLGIFCIFYIFKYDRVFESDSNIYEEPPPIQISQHFLHIQFREVAENLGLIDLREDPHEMIKSLRKHYKEHEAEILKQNKKVEEALSNESRIQGHDRDFPILPHNISLFPSVSVVDIDNDGYMDVFFPQTKGNPNKLYRNINGEKFLDVAEEYGLANLNVDNNSNMAYFVDFNQDGLKDLLLTRWDGCHELHIRVKGQKRFINKSENLEGYCSYSRGVNFIDFNKDGITDIVFGNFILREDIDSLNWKMDGIFLGNKLGGGRNVIFQGLPDAKFKLRKDISFGDWRSFTQTTAVIDINYDGWDDIVFTNNYSTDEVWINDKGQNFIDKTDKYFPSYKHGFSGMNAEVYDIDSDGIYEMYITNTFKPPFIQNLNNLWKADKKGGSYSQVSVDLGLSKCGYAWGAKFGDLDNNGTNELLVINGRSAQTKKTGDRKASFWYYLYENTLTPRFLREYREKNEKVFFRYSSHERNCLFVKEGEKYYDIATQAGFHDLLDGRGIAVIDFNNDGKLDYLIANHTFLIRGKALLYKNETLTKGNWVGLDINNKTLKASTIGIKVELITQNEKRLYKNLNPFNGFRGQSDPRIHFGLGADTPKQINIFTQDGRIIEISDIILNQYNKINI